LIIKKGILIFVAIFALALSGCSTPISQSETPSPDDSNYEEYTPEPTQSAQDIVSATRKTLSWNRNGDCANIYDSLYLAFTLKNISGKSIDAIELEAEILDEFGDSLKKVNLESGKTFSAGKQMVVGSTGTKCFKLNNYDAGDNTILNWSSGDQGQLTLSLNRVKFKDGTIENFYGDQIYDESFTVN
jgi:hypothetical protein